MITLNDGTVVLIDREDKGWARQWSWSHSCSSQGRQGYAARGGETRGKKWLRYMHREIAMRMGILTSYEDRREVDHVNRNHFDNRRVNLRVATRSQNAGNVAPRNRSGVLGVYQNKSGLWGFEVRRDGRRHRRYGFKTPTEAFASRERVLEELGTF